VSKFLKGNFKVKREINLDEEADEKKLMGQSKKFIHLLSPRQSVHKILKYQYG